MSEDVRRPRTERIVMSLAGAKSLLTSAPTRVRGASELGRRLGEQFDVVAASWLILLAIAWAIYFASMSASRPSDWSGPLIGGPDWNAASILASPGATPAEGGAVRP